jgi:starch-binding outer membrane protein, SusD/RagB family
MDPANPTGTLAYGDQPYLRLAETYLLLAEAEMKQGKLTEAAEHLNVLRRRAHASEITPAQVTMDFILDERARELLTEEHRRYTLLRTGTWLERTRKYNPVAGPNIAEHNALYPIPQVVIDANLDREMKQNPGY